MAEEVMLWKDGESKVFQKGHGKIIFCQGCGLFFFSCRCVCQAPSLWSATCMWCFFPCWLSPNETHKWQPAQPRPSARDAAFVLEAHWRNCDLQVSCYSRNTKCSCSLYPCGIYKGSVWQAVRHSSWGRPILPFPSLCPTVCPPPPFCIAAK